MTDHIKVNDVSPRTSVVLTAAQTDVTIPFKFFDNADIRVYLDGTLKTLTTHYTVTGAGLDSGTRKITLVTPAVGDEVCVIRRAIVVKRLSDYTDSGSWTANNVNTDFDKLVMMAQEVQTEAGRAIRLTDDDADAELELPAAASRANKALVFDADGDVTVSADDYEDQAADAAASALAASGSASAAAASAVTAATQAGLASTAKTAAEAAQALAEAAQAAAETAETNAGTAETNAAASAAAAQVAKIEWQSAWLTATVYAVNDAVSQGGSSYICLVDHTSGTFATDLSANKWELLAEKGADGAGSGDFMADGSVPMTGPLVFEGATADAFETTLVMTDPTADRTITFPDATGTVLLGGAPAQGVIDDLAAITYAQGDVLYHNGSNLVKLAAGTSGQYLKTQGAGANPLWADIVSGSSFVAHKNGTDQTAIGTGTWTKLTLPTASWNTASSYDAANSKFIPSVAGKYRLNASALFSAGIVDQSGYYIAFRLNGAEICRSIARASGTNPVSTAISRDVDLNGSTDYVEVFVYGEGAGDKSVYGGSTETWFSGGRVV
jgi:hypothetical protein